MVLANNGEINAYGLLDLYGIGWNCYRVPAFPSTVQGVVGGLATFSADEKDETFEATMTLRQGTETIDSRSSFVLTAESDTVPFVVPFAGIVRDTTDLEVWVEDETGPLAIATCRIVIAEPEFD
jgi:hypothetical protein